MGDNLLEWDQIFRALVIGLEFAPTILTGYGLTWLVTKQHIADQRAEIEFLQKLIECQMK